MPHVSDLPVVFHLVSAHSFQFLRSLLQSNFRLSQKIWKWSELIESSLKIAVDLYEKKTQKLQRKKLENQILEVTLISFLISLQSEN